MIKLRYLVLALVMMLITGFMTSTNVYAASPLISTDYPGVVAQPGANLAFPLTISDSNGKVSLQVSSAPKGWNAELYGDGRLIHEVFVKPGDEVDAELRVKVPQDAKEGDYKITVSAGGASGSSALSIDIRVSTNATGSDELEVQYPSLSGPDTATFNFSATLSNNSGRSRSYSLGVDAPEGWQVTFKPAYQSNQIASLSLEAGRTQDLDISVDPPDNVTAGKYNITVAAVSGQDVAKANLEVIITGTYRLNLTTPNERLNADVTAGRRGSANLVLKNEGSADLQGITFSSSAPQNWSVTFEPDSIDVLPAGEERQITAYITPDGRAIAGDYMVSITARTRETSESIELRTTVHTSTLWGLVGAAIVVIVIGWVSWAFRKYGRR
ncbi:MAG: NEW3 domain-containing protein [Thermoanaerobacteraceae bacterium]|nr:NEW3 domain-containing protein [Thermoanaerobacteraceae bacterium]